MCHQFDADELPVELPGGNAGRSGTGKWIKYASARAAPGGNTPERKIDGECREVCLAQRAGGGPATDPALVLAQAAKEAFQAQIVGRQSRDSHRAFAQTAPPR